MSADGVGRFATMPAGTGGGRTKGQTQDGDRNDLAEDAEQFHVSMLRIPFGPWQLTMANSQRDV